MSSKKAKVLLVSLFLSLYRFLTSQRRVSDKRVLSVGRQSIAIFSSTALGDFMFNTPAILAVKSTYPDADIILVSGHKNKTLVEESPWFKRVLYWDQKIISAIGLIFSLRKSKPDIVILLHSKSPWDVMCATLCGATYIFKDAYNKHDLAMKKFVTSVTGIEFPGHLIERKMQLVSGLGCDTSAISMQIPFPVSKPARDNSVITIGFQLGASEVLRRWPVYRFQELAGLLISSEENYRIVLIGSEQERELSASFLRGLSANEQKFVTDYVGCCSLTELVRTISGFDLLITGDTGPLHLAVALRVKTISLFVTANPDHTGPLQDPDLHTVIRAAADEQTLAASNQPMAVISAKEVMAAISDAKG